MARKVHLPSGFEKLDFKTPYEKAPCPKGRIRCLAMLLLQQGKSIQEVSEVIEQSRVAIHEWLRWLREAKGLEHLQGFVQGRGRKAKIEGISQQKLCESIVQCSENREGGRMTGSDVQRLLHQKWSVSYKLSSVYALLHRLGLVWITARSKHPKMDPLKQQAFKKTSGAR